MPKYHILYKPFSLRGPVFKTEVEKNTETEARVYFEKSYNADLLQIRKGIPFTDAEIKKLKAKLKYA